MAAKEKNPVGRKPGRQARPQGIPTVQLNSRVVPEAHDHANTLADACGVVWGVLLERLLEHTIREADPSTGRPPWWDAEYGPTIDYQERLVS